MENVKKEKEKLCKGAGIGTNVWQPH